MAPIDHQLADLQRNDVATAAQIYDQLLTEYYNGEEDIDEQAMADISETLLMMQDDATDLIRKFLEIEGKHDAELGLERT